MENEILDLLLTIDYDILLLDGIMKGILYSVSVGLFAQGINYILRLFKN